METPTINRFTKMAITATATVALFTSGIAYNRLLPVKFHPINLYGDEKSWDRSEEPLYYLTVDNLLASTEAISVLQKFVSNMLDKSEDLNPDIAKIINKNFSKLL